VAVKARERDGGGRRPSCRLYQKRGCVEFRPKSGSGVENSELRRLIPWKWPRTQRNFEFSTPDAIDDEPINDEPQSIAWRQDRILGLTRFPFFDISTRSPGTHPSAAIP